MEHNGNIVRAFSEENAVCIIISISKESFDVRMNGIDNNNFVEWYESDLKTGENIRIKVKDISQNSQFYIMKNRNDLLKKEFDLLEKELREKGLL